MTAAPRPGEQTADRQRTLQGCGTGRALLGHLNPSALVHLDSDDADLTALTALARSDSGWSTAGPADRLDVVAPVVFTGADLDPDRLRAALDSAVLDDGELALGTEGWARLPDPLLGDVAPGPEG